MDKSDKAHLFCILSINSTLFKYVTVNLNVHKYNHKSGRATSTLNTGATIDEMESVEIDCAGDQAIIDESNDFTVSLLINGSPGRNVEAPEKTKMKISQSSYTLHNGEYVCQITYLTKEMGEATVTSEAISVEIIGTV